MEFIRSTKEDNLDADFDEAIRQILKKDYDKVLPDGCEQQLIYDIAFYAKIAKVKLAI